MNMSVRRWLIPTLFAIWCISLSMTFYNLLLPWSQVVVTAGILFVVFGRITGLFEP